MKTLTQNILAAVSTLSICQVLLAQTPAVQTAQQKTRYEGQAQEWLTQKTSQVKTLDGGIRVKAASKESIQQAVNQAIKNIGGKATVDFGNNQKVEIKSTNKPENGVHVGSGADALVATSSADQAGQVVVQPPVNSPTSLTVVGRWGQNQKNMQVCVVGYKTDSKGQILLKKNQKLITPTENCTDLNKALRLQPGFYNVFFKAVNGIDGNGDVFVPFGSSDSTNYVSFLTQVQKGENKIIPLREIAVPKYPNTKPEAIRFNIYADMKSKSELSKRMVHGFYQAHPAVYDPSLRSLQQFVGDISRFASIAQQTSPSEFAEFCLSISENEREGTICSAADVGYDANSNYTTSSSQSKWNSHGDFVSVFPGTYAIDWLIDGVDHKTEGVKVE